MANPCVYLSPTGTKSRSHKAASMPTSSPTANGPHEAAIIVDEKLILLGLLRRILKMISLAAHGTGAHPKS